MDTPSAESERRHWLVDAAFGGLLALGLITAADASLPRIERLVPPSRPKLAVLPAAPAKLAARRPLPPALIAFQDPLPGYPIISPFGLRQLPWEEGGRLHAGVDIAAPQGERAIAAADGVVTRVATDAGYGRFVELKHAAGLSTRYAHLSSFSPQIAPGVAVKAGTPVGVIGSTGSSTGAHLHFEIRDEADRPLNPELFLGRRFAESGDLPLRAALRIPRGVRVAFVSRIPTARRAEMQAKQKEADEVAADEASDERVALNAGDAGVDTSAAARDLRYVEGRPHASLVAQSRPGRN
jgi:murein DD-endopeptidase MepM/ murein hydrolase activator NlpD